MVILLQDKSGESTVFQEECSSVEPFFFLLLKKIMLMLAE